MTALYFPQNIYYIRHKSFIIGETVEKAGSLCLLWAHPFLPLHSFSSHCNTCLELLSRFCHDPEMPHSPVCIKFLSCTLKYHLNYFPIKLSQDDIWQFLGSKRMTTTSSLPWLSHRTSDIPSFVLLFISKSFIIRFPVMEDF